MALLNKRQFLQTLTSASAAAVLPFFDFQKHFSSVQHLTASELAGDEDFWEKIRQGYTVIQDFIQLENGYFSLAADEVLAKYIEHIRRVNAASSYYMRTRQFDDKLVSRTELARLLGCSA